MNADQNLYKPIAGLALVTTILLSIPFIAMQFTDEVVWTLIDFAVMGTLIFGTGLTYILITWKSGDKAYRFAIAFALAAAFFLIWSNLAVGIISSEANPINLLYFVVIAIGIVGAFLSRFHAKGMVLTMFAVAFAQALVAAIALIGGYYPSPPSSVIEIISVNGFFILLFLVSALLFRYAALRAAEQKEAQ